MGTFSAQRGAHVEAPSSLLPWRGQHRAPWFEFYRNIFVAFLHGFFFFFQEPIFYKGWLLSLWSTKVVASKKINILLGTLSLEAKGTGQMLGSGKASECSFLLNVHGFLWDQTWYTRTLGIHFPALGLRQTLRTYWKTWHLLCKLLSLWP